MNPVELLVSAPEPFLGLIAVGLAVACLLIALAWPDGDHSDECPMPKPDDLDPLAIAFVRGERTAVVQAATFDLWCRGALDLAGSAQEPTLRSRPCDDDLGGPIHVAIYRFTERPQRATALHDDQKLTGEVDAQLAETLVNLERRHVVRTANERSRLQRPFWIALGVALCLGGSWLTLNVSAGRSIWYVVVLMFAAALVVLSVKTARLAQPNRLGRRYLASIEAHYIVLRQEVSAGRLPEGTSYALLPAVFGAEFLSSLPAFWPFRQAFADLSSGENSGSGCGCA